MAGSILAAAFPGVRHMSMSTVTYLSAVREHERIVAACRAEDEPAFLAALAVNEASRILSVSEPRIIAEGFASYIGKSDMRVTVSSRDYEAYRVASDCLADALASFV